MVVSVALWIVSLRWELGLWIESRRALSVSEGQVSYSEHFDHYKIRARSDETRSWWINRSPGPSRWWFEHRAGGYWEIWSAPLWPLSLCTSFVFASAQLWWWRRRRRIVCDRCGYDLAGLPGGSDCPECGELTPPRARSATTRLRAPASTSPTTPGRGRSRVAKGWRRRGSDHPTGHPGDRRAARAPCPRGACRLRTR